MKDKIYTAAELIERIEERHKSIIKDEHCEDEHEK